MHQFQNPKKNNKKCYRRKESFDLDALEAEAIAAGLGGSDLGRRSDPLRKAAREEEERSESDKRKFSYRIAKRNADEACRVLETEQIRDKKRKLGHGSGPEAIVMLIVASKANDKEMDDLKFGEGFGNEVVYVTETEGFVEGFHVDEGTKPGVEDFSTKEDEEAPKSFKEGSEKDYVVVPENDETIREAPVGKGIGSVLKLLKERGALKETVEHDDRQKEEFRLLSHMFHGKCPGKTKQEKRRKHDELEFKLKKMNYSDATSGTVERMREAQARLKTPYLVLD